MHYRTAEDHKVSMSDVTSSTELAALIGRHGLMPITAGGTVHTRVTVRDAKIAYGGARVLVSPLHGSGETWIELRRLILDREDITCHI